jgi:hypothetical protein
LETKPRPTGLETKPRPTGLETKPLHYGLETKPRPTGLETKPRPTGLETKPLHYGLETKPLHYGLETKPLHYGLETKPLHYGLETKPLHYGLETKPLHYGLETKPLHYGLETKPLHYGLETKPLHPKPYTPNMTQARDLLPLRLELVPMQLPEAPIEPVGRSAEQNALPIASGMVDSVPGFAGSNLLLYPGESSELLIRLKNDSDRNLNIQVEFEGNFPSHWCRLRMEGNQISAKSKIEGVLYFQLPADFFESNNLPINSNNPLTLDYSGQIHVYYHIDTENQTPIERVRSSAFSAIERTQSATFYLFVRPRSLYLDFLPELYREVDFIGRLMKIFEQAYEPAVNQLESLWAYLDPLTAPEMLLPFLSQWVGWKMDPRLSLTRQRYLIRQAIKLFAGEGLV